ncbi:MAG: hypothetical protein DWI22_08210 [Planctomycetota bacterium]|nr:MAG: hypothetical protein DWI22_08210 [Planctomycetota bacterium]
MPAFTFESRLDAIRHNLSHKQKLPHKPYHRQFTKKLILRNFHTFGRFKTLGKFASGPPKIAADTKFLSGKVVSVS